ncbi:MAG: SDR family oxidoreductase [Anaerolineae bacterium]|nr:SDR family oxidoreductase [Anaerolineae bacterium]
MKILLTGGAGKLGRHLGRYLVAVGHAVRSYDLASGDDLLDLERLSNAAQDCELTIHFGGLSHPGMGPPEAYLRVNVWGTIHAYWAAREAHHRQFIFASSGAVYGWDLPDGLRPRLLAVDEQTPLMQNVTEPYSYSKLVCENLLQAACQHDPRLPVIALRLAPLWNADQEPAEKYLSSALSPQIVCLVVEQLLGMSPANEYLALNIADPWRSGGYNINKAREMGVFLYQDLW